MTDPYRVLGVSRDATDEEIKTAYRSLAKKYHPDNYTNNPLGDLAEEKMKEINSAYEQIQDERSGKRSGYSRDQGFSSPSSGSGRFAEIYNLINTNRAGEAEVLLGRIDESDRDAEWHYLLGHVYYRQGRLGAARQEFQTACNMAPNNAEYRSAYDQMSRGSSGSPYGNGTSYNSDCGGDVCRGIVCANCLCNMMRCCY